MDIMLEPDGDLYLTDKGDIAIKYSVVQKVLIRARWFLGEWRWDEEEGLPYFEDVFKKNPATEAFKNAFRNKLYEVDEVKDVSNVEFVRNDKTREAVLSFTFSTDEQTYREEVALRG